MGNASGPRSGVCADSETTGRAQRARKTDAGLRARVILTVEERYRARFGVAVENVIAGSSVLIAAFEFMAAAKIIENIADISVVFISDRNITYGDAICRDILEKARAARRNRAISRL